MAAALTADVPGGVPQLQGQTERKTSANSTDSWDTYNFEWLFDVNRIDHLPIEEQLKIYKHRDLGKVKVSACGFEH